MQTKKKYNKKKSKYKLLSYNNHLTKYDFPHKCIYKYHHKNLFAFFGDSCLFLGTNCQRTSRNVSIFLLFQQIWEQYFITKKNI